MLANALKRPQSTSDGLLVRVWVAACAVVVVAVLCVAVCVLQVLQMIPENNNVGLITFGTHVHVHELGYAECSKAFVFRGSKEYSSSQVRPSGRVGVISACTACCWRVAAGSVTPPCSVWLQCPSHTRRQQFAPPCMSDPI